MGIHVNNTKNINNEFLYKNGISFQAQNNGGINSVFSVNQQKEVPKTEEEKKKEAEMLEKQKIIANASMNTLNKSGIAQAKKAAENIEKSLESSKVPRMTSIGSFVNQKAGEILEFIGDKVTQISDIDVEGLTKEEVNAKIKELTKEVYEKAAEAKAYVSRGQKAIELDKILSKHMDTPEKAEAINKKMDDIYNKLMVPPQIEADKEGNETENSDKTAGTESSTEKTDISDNKETDNFDDVIKDDKVGQEMDDLIKKLNDTKRGSSEDIVSVLNDDKSAKKENNITSKENENNNLFSFKPDLKKKNPFEA